MTSPQTRNKTPLDAAIFEGYQRGSARTVERVVASLEWAGASVEVRREPAARLLTLRVNGEDLRVEPFDGRVVLHLSEDFHVGDRHVVGVRKRAHGVAQAILRLLPSSLAALAARREADAQAERARRELERQARASRAATLRAEHEERKAEVAETEAKFQEVLRAASAWDVRARAHCSEPRFYAAGWPDRPGDRFPRERHAATVTFESLSIDELRVVLGALATHRGEARARRT